METTQILTKTFDLIDSIKETESYSSYIKYGEMISVDKELNQLIIDFQNKKEKFEEALKYGEYYPGIKKIKAEYQQAKIILMSNELFKSYKKYEIEVEILINEIEIRIINLLNIKENSKKQKLDRVRVWK